MGGKGGGGRNAKKLDIMSAVNILSKFFLFFFFLLLDSSLLPPRKEIPSWSVLAPDLKHLECAYFTGITFF